MRAAFSAGGEEGAATAATPPPPELPPCSGAPGCALRFLVSHIVSLQVQRSIVAAGSAAIPVTQLVEGARPIRGGSVVVEEPKGDAQVTRRWTRRVSFEQGRHVDRAGVTLTEVLIEARTGGVAQAA
jgi:hypothetical protein